MSLRLLAVMGLCALLLFPGAQAHGAPSPADPATRLLADWTDDCGGDGGAAGAVGACKGSDDLIALDVQELVDGGQDTVLFRFWLDKGRTYPVTDALTVNVGGASKTLSMRTTDDHSFSKVAGFDSVGSATAIGDGTRFTVDAMVSLAGLGAAAGSSITNFKVESQASGSVGDFMPGGCHNSIGECADNGASGGTYIAGGGSGSYTLRGAGYYARVEDDGAAHVGVGEEHIVQLTLTNPFRNTAQTYSLSVSSGDGVSARFHNPSSPSGEGYSDTVSVDVPKASQGIAHLAVTGTAASASGTLTVTVTSSLGGRTTHDVTYAVSDAAATGGRTTPPATSHKGSPAPSAPLALAVLAAALLVRRRA